MPQSEEWEDGIVTTWLRRGSRRNVFLDWNTDEGGCGLFGGGGAAGGVIGIVKEALDGNGIQTKEMEREEDSHRNKTRGLLSGQK